MPNPNELWLNDGAGVFTKSDQDFSSVYSVHGRDVAFGDLDADGDLDAFFANDLTQFGPAGESVEEVWLNSRDTPTALDATPEPLRTSRICLPLTQR